jgi:tetratricopeptide (TPR) repeat protein
VPRSTRFRPATTPRALLGLLILLSLTFPRGAASDETSWKAALDSGMRARKEAKYEDAERLLRAAVKDAETLGPQDSRLAKTLNELGGILRLQHKLDEAQVCHQRALKIAEATNNESSDVATSLYGLAVVEDFKGNADGAESLFKRAVAMREKTLGTDSPDVGRALYGFGNFRMDHQDFGQARALLQRAVSILEKNAGDDPEYLALALASLAAAQERQNQPAEASTSFERALREGERVLPAHHPILASIRINFAEFKLFTQHDAASAVPLFERGIPILDAFPGADKVGVAGYKGDLAQAYDSQQRYADAERMYSESLPVLEKAATSDKLLDASQLRATRARYEELKRYNRATRGATGGRQYETRYVNGTQFFVGTIGSLQVWLAAWKGSDLMLLVYAVNGGDQGITFRPEEIGVTAIQRKKEGSVPVAVRVYEAREYENKVRNRDAWDTALRGFALGMANTPQPQTSRVSGNYSTDYYGQGYGNLSGSYYGTITTWPTAQDQVAANERTQAQMQGMQAQLQASFRAMSNSLARAHTLDPRTYYGGMVYAKKKDCEHYEVRVPFGGESFQFTFGFGK